CISKTRLGLNGTVIIWRSLCRLPKLLVSNPGVVRRGRIVAEFQGGLKRGEALMGSPLREIYDALDNKRRHLNCFEDLRHLVGPNSSRCLVRWVGTVFQHYVDLVFCGGVILLLDCDARFE